MSAVGVEVNRGVCVGAGQCALVAPAVFDQGDDGLVVLLQESPVDGAQLRQAADLCPARAIEVRA